MKEKKHEILLGLTTTPASDWERKCNEIKQFGIKKVALFPTFLNVEKRKELYMLLEKSGLETIPHVHLRGQDMEAWEMEMFEKKYKTEFYNVHQSDVDSPVLDPYRSKLFVENQYKNFDESAFERCAGICADFSHMEDGRMWKNSLLSKMNHGVLDRHPIGCCHVSAVKLSKLEVINKLLGVSRHTLQELEEVDYMKKYKKYLPKYISLELQNSFEQQLEVKEYLEKLLDI